MTYRGHVKNGQVMLDEPVSLAEGTQVSIQVVADRNGEGAGQRRLLLRMPVEERRQLLMRQAARVAEHYEVDPDRLEWQGGDIVE
jgi:hypothetical protein